MGHEPVLIPDFTLFIQVGIFFACYFVLRALVFKPYLALLAARREKTSGLKAAAIEARAKAGQLREEYDAFMKAERKKIGASAEEERRRIAEEERRTIQAARSAASDELQAARTKLKAEFDKTRHALLPLIAEYSSQIASKLVGRKIQVQGNLSEMGNGNHKEQVVPN